MTPVPEICATVTGDQMACFGYVATAGDQLHGLLLAAVLFSIWAMFLFGVFVLWRMRRI